MEWKTSDTPEAYQEAVAFMEHRVRLIAEGHADEMVWLLEHPPLYTRGTSARESDFLGTMDFPVHPTGRGGEYTYHGPGQRVAYVMLDLKKRGPDVRRFVGRLEAWIIATLAAFGVRGMIREGRIGVWVQTPDGAEAKIAALGIRLRKWVSYHGVALNVDPDLSHFSGIVPCGIRGYGVTSLRALGIHADMRDIDHALKRSFETVF